MAGLTAHQIVYSAFAHFKAMDEANAAVHVADVRYSPLTFRLAELLEDWELDYLAEPAGEAVKTVLTHRGRYAEDPGR